MYRYLFLATRKVTCFCSLNLHYKHENGLLCGRLLGVRWQHVTLSWRLDMDGTTTGHGSQTRFSSTLLQPSNGKLWPNYAWECQTKPGLFGNLWVKFWEANTIFIVLSYQIFVPPLTCLISQVVQSFFHQQYSVFQEVDWDIKNFWGLSIKTSDIPRTNKNAERNPFELLRSLDYFHVANAPLPTSSIKEHRIKNPKCYNDWLRIWGALQSPICYL